MTSSRALLLALLLALLVAIAAGLLWWLLEAGQGGEVLREAGRGGAHTDAAPQLVGADVAQKGADDSSKPAEQPSSAPRPDVDGVVYHGGCSLFDPWAKAAVHVALTWPGGPTLEADTDGTNRYALPPAPRITAPTVGTLRFTQDDREHVVPVLLPHPAADRQRLPWLRLAGKGDVTVRVLLGGRAVEGAEIYLVSGGTEILARGVSGPDGVVRLSGVTPGNVLVLARGPEGQRGFASGNVPTTSQIDVELKPMVPVRVRVVADENDEPIAGAAVLAGSPLPPPERGPGCLPPSAVVVTDASGEAVVERIQGAKASVVVHAAELGRTSGVLGWREVDIPVGADQITVRLAAPRTLRFPLQGHIPAADVELAVTRNQAPNTWLDPEVRAWVDDGVLHVGPLPPGDDGGSVEAADGTAAAWSVQADDQPTQFVRRAALAIHASWPDGTPAAAQAFELWAPNTTRASGETDEAGRLVFPELTVEDVHLKWKLHDAYSVTVAELRIGAEPVEITLPALATYEVTVSRPADLTDEVVLAAAPYPLPVEDQPFHVYFPEMKTVSGLEGGQYRFRWFENEDGRPVPIRARTSDPEVATVRVLPARSRDGVWRAHVELARSSVLEVRVVPPSDGKYSCRIEAVDPARPQVHIPLDSRLVEQGRFGDEEGVHRYRGLPLGWYRVFDGRTGEGVEAVRVEATSDPLRVTLDLSDVVVVEGVVLAPDGYDMAGATVEIDGRRLSRPSSRSNPARVDPDGRFQLRVRRGTALRLLARHPVLTQPGGPVAYVVGSATPELQLRATLPLVRFQPGDLLPLPAELGASELEHASYEVMVARTVAGLPEQRNVQLARTDHGLELAVPEPGTWAVRITHPGYVPKTYPALSVPETGVDLGRVQLERGGTLVVRLHAGKEAVTQFLAVSATLDEPGGYRAARATVTPGDPPRSILPGLGRGRFRVRVQRMYVGDEAPLLETEIDSDGRSTVTLDVRLP